MSLYLYASCSSSSPYGDPVTDPEAITKDMMSWLYYDRDEMLWSEDYVALDTAKNKIDKRIFLERLTTGKYVPVKLSSSGSQLYYQLCPMSINAEQEIIDVIKRKAEEQYRYFEMEKKLLPGFVFRDMEGEEYSTISTKGKVVVINCWFINCKPCVAEIPELNRLADQCTGRDDVVFLALTFDARSEVEQFLKQREFKYRVIPEAKKYLDYSLQVQSYPTHIVVGKDGLVAKVIPGDVKALVAALNRELSK